MKQAGRSAVGSDDAAFGQMVAALRAGQDRARAIRPELLLEDVPAPRTLAPYAVAVGASVREAEEEISTGRFVVLYDPAGQRGWGGPLRVIVYIHADLDPEIAADPLLGQVAWSWLTEALDTCAARYAAPSGTVTRAVTEGFGAKDGERTVSGVELRASWSPLPGPGGAGAGAVSAAAGLSAHFAAWCGALCAASGLPPLAPGIAALRPPGRRQGP